MQRRWWLSVNQRYRQDMTVSAQRPIYLPSNVHFDGASCSLSPLVILVSLPALVIWLQWVMACRIGADRPPRTSLAIGRIAFIVLLTTVAIEAGSLLSQTLLFFLLEILFFFNWIFDVLVSLKWLVDRWKYLIFCLKFDFFYLKFDFFKLNFWCFSFFEINIQSIEV